MIPSVLPTYNRAPLSFVKGEGSWLWAEDGRRYLDLGSGIAVNALGHAHPALVQALTDQAQKLWHVSNVYTIPEQERLAKLLIETTFADTVFFTNSGTETAELAIKMARKFHYDAGQPERTEIVAFEGAFHGRSTGAIAAAGSEKMVKGFGPPDARLQAPEMARERRRPRGHPRRDHRQDLRRDHRADPGRGRHPRRPRPVPEGSARPLRPDRHAADLRRGAMRHGPHRPPFRA